MPVSLRRPPFPLAALLVLALALAGCGRSSVGMLPEERNETEFQHAKTLAQEGRHMQALAAYLSVIAERGTDHSPESHLEAGILYLEKSRDPIYAIYHFSEYLRLMPKSRQAASVEGQIEAAKREFAKTLFAQLPDERRELQEEIARLRNEVQALRGTPGGRGAAPAAAGGGAALTLGTPRGRAAAAPSDSPIIPVGNPAEAGAFAAGDLQAAAPASRGASPAASGRGAPASSGKIHQVAQKESLYEIARKHYGTPTNARIEAIKAANGLTSDSITPGMQLKIP